MVYDLDDRIRAYAEHLEGATPSVTAETARRIAERRPQPTRLTAAVAAAGLVVLALALVVVLNPLGSESPVVEQPATVSTTVASEPTTNTEAGPTVTTGAAPTTTTEAAAPPAAMTWTRIESDVFGGSGRQWISGIAVGGPGLVAVGGDSSGGDDDAAVWYSSDGLSWSRVEHDEAVFGGSGRQYMTAVTAGGPGFVAVGEESVEGWPAGVSVVWVSEDGVIWSRVPHDEAAFGVEEQTTLMKDVTAFGSGLVAVGMESTGNSIDAAAWISTDGISWERIPPDEAVFGGPQYQVMWAVVPAGPGLVAVGQGGDGAGESGPGQPAAVWTSTDGRTWSRVPEQAGLLSGYPAGEPGSGDWARMDDVMVGGPGVVAVGRVGRCQAASPCTQEAAIWTSPDGVTWERSTVEQAVGTPFDQLFGVSTFGEVLIAAGDGRDADFQRGPAVVWSSTDGGYTWERVLSAAAFGKMNEGPNQMFAAVEFGSRLIAAGSSESDAAIWIATSEE